MRRKDRGIENQNEIMEIIKRCRVCSLAFSGEDYPYVIPINFGVGVKDGKTVFYFHGAGEGTKFDRIKCDNRTAFSMYAEEELVLKEPACKTTMLYESVCGTGRASVVEDMEEKYEALNLIMRQYDRESGAFEFDARVVEKTAVFKLEVEDMTGKTNRPKNR
ncbi:pyridoxamine 5'-phosphate oxidase family protein [uncultured Clostridium sp.]|uniref:pyridoxamine 5'-phosphate oxidase family protein n=1 Tax=uncultured Clostridium sp. TaxID=59620 RepID=UPI0025F61DD1|nr:pyridoxamine 5'-phosphate oxidase family protein [uncultured Clostridium sp.]